MRLLSQQTTCARSRRRSTGAIVCAFVFVLVVEAEAKAVAADASATMATPAVRSKDRDESYLAADRIDSADRLAWLLLLLPSTSPTNKPYRSYVSNESLAHLESMRLIERSIATKLTDEKEAQAMSAHSDN